MNKKLIKNQAQCLLCNDIIISTHSHAYVTCKCGNLSVDGGNEYARRLFSKQDSYQDLCEYEDIPEEK